MVQHPCLNRSLNLIEIGSWNKPYEEKDLVEV